MSDIVVNTDFVGKHELALTQFNTSEIDAYILKYERIYLLKLLGAELYTLFVADLSGGVPTDPIYTAIFDAFERDVCNRIEVSEGIKEMLLGFIYYEYCHDIAQNQTPIGATKPKNENSTVLGLNGITITRYNEAVDTAKAIQSFILDNSTDYPSFNGQEFKYEYFL